MAILHIVGARPNFMKAAPVYKALAKAGVEQALVHTGQHYDVQMSDVFFETLAIPEPDESLNVGSGSHAQQTAAIMSRFEPVVLARAVEAHESEAVGHIDERHCRLAAGLRIVGQDYLSVGSPPG